MEYPEFQIGIFGRMESAQTTDWLLQKDSAYPFPGLFPLVGYI